MPAKAYMNAKFVQTVSRLLSVCSRRLAGGGGGAACVRSRYIWQYIKVGMNDGHIWVNVT